MNYAFLKFVSAHTHLVRACLAALPRLGRTSVALSLISLFFSALIPQVSANVINSTDDGALVVARDALQAERIHISKKVYDVSADGRLMVYAASTRSVANNTVTTSLWLQDLLADTEPRRLATERPAATESGISPQLSPDARVVAYISGENPGAVTLINLHSGLKTLITPRFAPAPDAKVTRILTGVRWSPGGGRLAVLFSELIERDPQVTGRSVSVEWLSWMGLDPVPVQRLAVLNAEGGHIIAMTSAARQVSEAEWSPDGRFIAFTADRAVSTAAEKALGDGFNSDIYLLDPDRGKESVAFSGPGWNYFPRWSPDGRRIAFYSKPRLGATTQVGILEVGRRSVRFIGEEWHFTHNDYVWVGTGQLAIATFERMGCPIRTVDVESGDTRQVSPDNLDCNLSLAWSPEAKKLFFKRHSYSNPIELAVSALDSWSPKLITKFGEAAKLPAANVRTVSWPSKDGRFTVHGVLVTPMDGHLGRRPLVVSIQGGPIMVDAQTMGGGHAQHLLHPLLARGYAVLMPNTRGRAGYGWEFIRTMRDHQDYLEGPLNDLMGGVDLVERMGIADTDRLAVIGFSYGGALAPYAAAKSNRFKAAVSGDSLVLDLVGPGYMTASASYSTAVGRSIMGMGSIYEPGSKDAHIRNSTLTYVRETTAPVLLECGIITGAGSSNDCNKFYHGLQYYKIPSELVVYPRTGHGIWEPALKYDSERRRLEWLDYWVLGKPIPSLVKQYGPPQGPEWRLSQ